MSMVAQGVPVTVAVTVPDPDTVAVALPDMMSDASTIMAPKLSSPSAAASALKAQDMTWARGLSAAVARSVATHPLRICILDNSGSMRSGDGKVLVGHNRAFKTIGCSRWRELTEDAVQLAKMSEALGARTDFHLLNPVPGMSACSVCADAWSEGIRPLGKAVDVQSLQHSLSGTTPNGTTPLTESVMRVVSMITPLAPRLRAQGQAVAVVICTDGLPNDKASFVQAMRLLQTLPVWCVVRLVTDDDSVVDFWNDLDRALEAPLEVLDDVHGEAAEVHRINPWLTYAPPLQLARLFGMPEKLFDALDEQRLPPSQIAAFLRLLLGVDTLPEPELDVPAFLEAVRLALMDQPLAFDPKTRSMKPWVDLRHLERAVKSGNQEGCAIM